MASARGRGGTRRGCARGERPTAAALVAVDPLQRVLAEPHARERLVLAARDRGRSLGLEPARVVVRPGGLLALATLRVAIEDGVAAPALVDPGGLGLDERSGHYAIASVPERESSISASSATNVSDAGHLGRGETLLGETVPLVLIPVLGCLPDMLRPLGPVKDERLLL